MKGCTEQFQPGTVCENKHKNVQIFRIQFIFTLATIISDVIKDKKNLLEMISVQIAQRTATQNKGSLTSISESAMSS